MFQFPKDEEYHQKWFFLCPPSQLWKYFYFRSATDASWKERVLSLLQQTMLVEASKVSFPSNELDFCSPKDVVEVKWLPYNFFGESEVDNLNKISLEDANVTYFDNGYIGCIICWQRKCTDCKVLLLADSKRRSKLRNTFLKNIYLFLKMLIDVSLPQLSYATLFVQALVVLFCTNFGCTSLQCCFIR